MFCPECLQEHINRLSVSNTYFTCPVCQIKIQPFDTEKPRKEWTKWLPTNSNDLKPYLEFQNSQCITHCNETLNIKCKTCDVLICGQCCLSGHGKCEKTLSKDGAKNLKDKLSAYQQNLKVKSDTLESSLAKLKEDKNVKVSQIKQMTRELLDYLSSQEKYCLKKNKQESDMVEEQKDKILKILEMAEENINDLDDLVGEEDAENEPKSLTTFNYQPRHTLMSMTDSFQVREDEDNFQINQTFLKLKAELLKSSMMTKVEIPASTDVTTTDDTDVAITDGASNLVETEPKVIEMLQQSEACPFHFKQNIILNVKLLTGINDMIMIPDEPDQCFLITEACGKKIWKFSTAGQWLKNVVFKTEPYGLCLLQENCVAVSQPFESKIHILNCGDLTEKENFTFGKRYYGLASDDNKNIYSLYRNKTMCVDIISKKGPESSYEISQVIKLPVMFYTCIDYRLRALPSGYLLIINSLNSMNCINQNGDMAFCYDGGSDNKLCSIADIAVSRNFIYITDKSANNIHRIRHNGNFVDIPLNGISQPKKLFAVNGDVVAILSKPSGDMQIQLFSN